MAGTTLATGTLVKCPHCGKEQEEPVEYFVIPGKTGPASRCQEECIHCYESFYVQQSAPGEFLVEED